MKVQKPMPDMETVKRSVVKLRRISAKIEAAMLEIDGVVAALGQSSRQRRLDRLERSLSRYEKM